MPGLLTLFSMFQQWQIPNNKPDFNCLIYNFSEKSSGVIFHEQGGKGDIGNHE